MTGYTPHGPLGVREPQPAFQLGLQDAIFGGQIFVPRQQLLVHRPRDEGQDAPASGFALRPTMLSMLSPHYMF